jgi:parallel beta-helix repeat protein
VDGNVIANNAQQGVGINSGGSQNRIVNNSIRSNGLLGIDLFDTANNSIGTPSLTSATFNGTTTQVAVNLAALPAGNTYSVQFFINSVCDPSGFGEGAQLLATRTIASPGSTESINDAGVGQFVTVTATDVNGNTTEFSNCRVVNTP